MKKIILKIAIIGIGFTAGFLYYKYVGCNSGTCAITSNPYISTIYGGIMGLLLSFIVDGNKKEKSDASV